MYIGNDDAEGKVLEKKIKQKQGFPSASYLPSVAKMYHIHVGLPDVPL